MSEEINDGRVNTSTVESSKKKKIVNMRYLRDRDREKVKGVFNFNEQKGGVLKFAFRKYLGDKIEIYELEDGKVYSLPRGVAKHLNASGTYKTHEFVLGENGKQVQKVGVPVRRYGFQSLEFTSWEELEKGDKLVTVENI